MLKHSILVMSFSMLCGVTAFNASAAETTPSNPDQPKTMPYGDNPNIFRVLTYKTGQSISRLGNSIQRGAEKSSNKISEKWQDTKEFGTEQSQVAKEKAGEAKTFTEQKWQQTKDAVVGTNGGTVPIEQGTLSQSPQATNNLVPQTSSVTPSATTTPLPESANP